jgi:hypothetical protein
MAAIARETMQELVELVDEAKQWVQEARTAADEETRRKKLELAEQSLRRIESLTAGEEG